MWSVFDVFFSASLWSAAELEKLCFYLQDFCNSTCTLLLPCTFVSARVVLLSALLPSVVSCSYLDIQITSLLFSFLFFFISLYSKPTVSFFCFFYIIQYGHKKPLPVWNGLLVTSGHGFTNLMLKNLYVLVCCQRLCFFAHFIGVNMLSILTYLISFLRYVDTFIYLSPPFNPSKTVGVSEVNDTKDQFVYCVQ